MKLVEGNVRYTCCCSSGSAHRKFETGVLNEVRSVSRVRFPIRFSVALALVKVLMERCMVDGVSVRGCCGEGEGEGLGEGRCKGDRGGGRTDGRGLGGGSV